ncbi:MAG TPA: CRTAC1 family protein, partial [Candidatus Limnocylindrales bacterium]|nr:CRTAC1 family protein [Candidatus Limnocylindrales bacterium]
FTRVTAGELVTTRAPYWGGAWGDYDDDGWLDLFVVNGYSRNERDEWEARGGLPTTRLFRNRDGRFVDVTDEAGAAVAVRGQGCVAADLDLDGHTDLYVTGADRSTLLWNDGDEFTEADGDVGVRVFGWHTGAAVGDLDGNGRPDLVVAGYVDEATRIPEAELGFPNTHAGRRDLLFLNDGDRRFREVGREAGLEVVRFGYGLGVALADFERDGDLDVHLANDTNPNRLYENVPWPGGVAADPAGLGFRFEERAAAAGVADPGAGMGVAVGDWDADGRSDIFVSNSRGQGHALYRSNPPDANNPSFADARADAGIDLERSTGWGASWADLDHDTDLDLVLANGYIPVTDLRRNAEPLQVFRNLLDEGRDGRFEEAGTAVRGVGRLVARGSAVADYDNDGDLDVAVLPLGRPLVLLENRGAAESWLEVALEGSPPGAEVTATLPSGRELRRELAAGGSYLSTEDSRLHFGLGGARVVPQLRVRWPGGEETVLRDVETDRILEVDAP